MNKKTKKPKPRYFSARDIREDIDKYNAKLVKLCREAEAEDKLAEDFTKLGPLQVEHAGFHKCKADRLRRSALRIRDKKLPYLKDKLAEFNTDLLPNTGVEDRSVPK